MCLRRMYILLLLNGTFSVSLLSSSGRTGSLQLMFSVWIYLLLKVGYSSSLLLCFCVFLPQICYYLLYIFISINIYKCYIFLSDRPLYHHLMTLFVYYYSLCRKIYFVLDVSMAVSALFWFQFTWNFFPMAILSVFGCPYI